MSKISHVCVLLISVIYTSVCIDVYALEDLRTFEDSAPLDLIDKSYEKIPEDNGLSEDLWRGDDYNSPVRQLGIRDVLLKPRKTRQVSQGYHGIYPQVPTVPSYNYNSQPINPYQPASRPWSNEYNATNTHSQNYPQYSWSPHNSQYKPPNISYVSTPYPQYNVSPKPTPFSPYPYGPGTTQASYRPFNSTYNNFTQIPPYSYPGQGTHTVPGYPNNNPIYTTTAYPPYNYPGHSSVPNWRQSNVTNRPNTYPGQYPQGQSYPTNGHYPGNPYPNNGQSYNNTRPNTPNWRPNNSTYPGQPKYPNSYPQYPQGNPGQNYPTNPGNTYPTTRPNAPNWRPNNSTYPGQPQYPNSYPQGNSGHSYTGSTYPTKPWAPTTLYPPYNNQGQSYNNPRPSWPPASGPTPGNPGYPSANSPGYSPNTPNQPSYGNNYESNFYYPQNNLSSINYDPKRVPPNQFSYH